MTKQGIIDSANQDSFHEDNVKVVVHAQAQHAYQSLHGLTSVVASACATLRIKSKIPQAYPSKSPEQLSMDGHACDTARTWQCKTVIHRSTLATFCVVLCAYRDEVTLEHTDRDVAKIHLESAAAQRRCAANVDIGRVFAWEASVRIPCNAQWIPLWQDLIDGVPILHLHTAKSPCNLCKEPAKICGTSI